MMGLENVTFLGMPEGTVTRNVVYCDNENCQVKALDRDHWVPALRSPDDPRLG